MKIKAEKWIIDGDTSYKILEIEKCCDKLINSKNISLNKAYDENEPYDYDGGDYTVKLKRIEPDNEYGDEIYYETISFCPFCGEPIVIEIINTIDKTEKYNQLKTERELLWKKCCKTDSKKKARELNEQVRGLDNKINELLKSDDF